jgi:hypothetical protein
MDLLTEPNAVEPASGSNSGWRSNRTNWKEAVQDMRDRLEWRTFFLRPRALQDSWHGEVDPRGAARRGTASTSGPYNSVIMTAFSEMGVLLVLCRPGDRSGRV